MIKIKDIKEEERSIHRVITITLIFNLDKANIHLIVGDKMIGSHMIVEMIPIIQDIINNLIGKSMWMIDLTEIKTIT